MADPIFERSVFVNCPFDGDYVAMLQALCFCLIYLGFSPRLAPENADNAAARLDRIIELVRGSKYGVHDLSRCKSAAADDYARMNMPFELGIDYACRKFGGGQLAGKAILVLEQTRYDYRVALSDISGWDIEAHEGDFLKAIRKVRNWLVSKAGIDAEGPARIGDRYADFLGWHYEKQLAKGFSEDDIEDYPTNELIKAMLEWIDAGGPIVVA